MLPGAISAVAARPSSSQTTPSRPVCQVGLARPHWAISASTSAWVVARSRTWLQPSPCASHQAPQALMDSSSMRASAKPTPATGRPAMRTPRAYQRKSQAGLEDAAGAVQAAPSQVGTRWRTMADSRSRRPESCPLARMRSPRRVWPL